MRRYKKDRNKRVGSGLGKQLRFESLEDKRLLAVVWANEFGSGANDPNFGLYGGNEVTARAIVNRAISDWNKIITDQNFDNDANPSNNNYMLRVFASPDLGPGVRGGAVNFQYTTGGAGQTGWRVGVPMAAEIRLDDNGGGGGWFFDQTPLDDAEFTALVNSGAAGTGTAFQGSFVDVSTAGLNYNDFYRTITHEIGHALGIGVNGIALDSGIFPIENQTTWQQTYLAPNNVDPILGSLTYVGLDQVENFRTEYIMYFGISTPFTFANELWQYTLPGGGTVTFTEAGGGHIYEGTAAAPVHPNDLMNAGRTVPPPGGNPVPTTRQFVSDLNVQFLQSAFNYVATLPSSVNTAHASLDDQTGTLLVQGRTGNVFDTVIIDIVGTDTRVRVNGTTELFPTAHVRQIVFDAHGGGDTLSVPGITVPVNTVYWVVSSNQDATDPGTLGNVFVDLDPLVPGQQVSLRAAIQDASAGAGGTIYAPRGRYQLAIGGTGGVAQGDLDITESVTIIGTGAGETVIDANSLDRVFEVNGIGKTLTLDSVTVTGGSAPTATHHGGGIYVHNNSTLAVKNSAIVKNKTVTMSGLGGAIYFEQFANGTISKSVITDNDSDQYYTGGVYLAGATGSPVYIDHTIIALNTEGASGNADAATGGRNFTSYGYNRIGIPGGTLGFTGPGDSISNTANQIVTGIADTFNHADDASVKSLRDAIDLAAAGDEVWLPAWSFVLTRVRLAGPPATETDIAQGDIEVKVALTVRGIGSSGLNPSTSVAWRAGSPVDKVFELFGDYNGNGIVDNADSTLWRNQSAPADGDENGTIDNLDYNIWRSHWGNTLAVVDVAV